MKTETVIEEYESEAEAREHIRKRRVFQGASTEPRVMKLAARQADQWGLPYSAIEVIEVTDRDGPNECVDPRGNLDDCLALTKCYLTKSELMSQQRNSKVSPLTGTQKKCLEWMRAHDGQSLIRTGYKTVITRESDPQAYIPVIGLSINVLNGLLRRKLIEPVGDFTHVYRLIEFNNASKDILNQ